MSKEGKKEEKKEDLIQRAIKAFGERLKSEGEINGKRINLFLDFDEDKCTWVILVYINFQKYAMEEIGSDYEIARKRYLELKEKYGLVETMGMEEEDVI